MSSAPPVLDDRRFVLTLGCPDRPGIIAKITSFITEFGGSIVEAGYHSDPDISWFFTRQAIKASTVPFGIAELRDRFAGVAADFGPETEWQLLDSGERRRAVLLVSKDGHCLHDLLGRATSGELPATIEAVIGNHPDLADMTEAHGVKFHHVPFPKDPAERGPAFEGVRALVDAHDPHAVVLARFMQVLPAELCEHWAGKAINLTPRAKAW